MNDIKLLLKHNPTWEIEDLVKDRYLYFVANTMVGEVWVVDKMVTTKDGIHRRAEIFQSKDFNEALQVFTTGKKPKEEKGGYHGQSN